MLRTTLISLITIASILLLAACGGANTSLDAGATRMVAELPDGVPGVDYDPNVIVVNYKPGAKVPAHLRGKAPKGVSAAELPFAIVRKHKQFEVLTDAVAGGYGLEIGRQVYVDGLQMSSFTVPAGEDPREVLAQLRSGLDGQLESAEFARLYHKSYTPNDPDFQQSMSVNGPQWGLKMVGCEEAWDVTRGVASVRIAVCDTGVRLSHEELRSQVLVPSEEFPGENLDIVNIDNTVEDNDGHGTFIAGLVAAEQDNSRTITGVAPLCEVIPIKIAEGGVTSDYMMAQGVSLAVELGAQVVNLSWGGPQGSSTMQNLVDSTYRAGSLLVVAAGNEGITGPAYPAFYDNCLTVGSTNAFNQRSNFSNYGDYVDIAAPGEWLKSCKQTGDSIYEPNGAGTSYAAPIVAAAAGLLWSYNPQLTVDEVREKLVSTTAPTEGFSTSNPVGRLDIPAALATIESLSIAPPRPSQLVHSGVIYLEPIVEGQPDSVEMYVNDQLIDNKTQPPYIFGYDTGATEFDLVTVDFATVRGSERTFVTTDILVDNSSGDFPVTESFEETSSRSFKPVELNFYSDNFITAIKQQNPDTYSIEDIRADSGNFWMIRTDGAAEGSRYQFFGDAQANGYGDSELNALVSRKLVLDQVENPTFVFQHKLNFEDGGQQFDTVSVLVTTDGGTTFTPAMMPSGGPAIFSGEVPDWTQVQIDLSQYVGQTVHMVLLVETDSSGAGENPDAEAGWWVDYLTVYSGYNDGLPHIGEVSVEDGAVYGTVPGVMNIELALYSTQNMATATYTLDLKPVGEDNGEDLLSGPVTTSFFTHTFSIPATLPNQEAMLTIEYADAEEVAGDPIVMYLYIHNKVGDCNGDGLVDESDTEFIRALIGTTSGEQAYNPLLDTDGDGTITEADVAAIGYNWNGAT